MSGAMDAVMVVLLVANLGLVVMGVVEDVLPTAIIAALGAAWCVTILVLL